MRTILLGLSSPGYNEFYLPDAFAHFLVTSDPKNGTPELGIQPRKQDVDVVLLVIQQIDDEQRDHETRIQHDHDYLR